MDGGSVGDDLAHCLADLGRVEAHHYYGVCAHRRRIAHEPVDRLASGLLKQLRVFVDFAAYDGAKAGHDVAAKSSRAHDDAESLTERLPRAMSRNVFP